MLALQLIGAAMLLTAYFGVPLEWWREVDDRYITLNIVGAALLAATGWIENAYGFAILNTIWCFVAMRSGVSMRNRRG